ncbi:hypothetical protein EMGBS8_05780 [Verrucomicrobiota bacterium]|nr:hypothetical protein EMGBS8_05780 [Verrucomicrobiota bacterium]
MKHLYAHDRAVLTDLDFYLQAESNRGHFSSSVFLSSPGLYLHNHIASTNTPTGPCASGHQSFRAKTGNIMNCYITGTGSFLPGESSP